MDETKFLERLVAVEEGRKSNTIRLGEHDERLDKLEKTYSMLEKMDYRIGQVENTITNIDQKLDKKINADKDKKMEWFDYILKGILTIILGYIAIQLGLK